MIVHEAQFFESPNDLLYQVVRQAVAMQSQVEPEANWEGGFVWVRTVMDTSEVLMEEFLQGRLHVSMVWFAEMPEYRPEVIVSFKSQNMSVKLRRTDSSESRAFPPFFEGFIKLRNESRTLG